MKIGILGAGSMAAVLGTRWHAAGHHLMVGARDGAKAEGLAREIGPDVRSGSLPDAAEFGEVVLLAIRPTGVLDALLQCGAATGSFAGTTVIDCNNPVETTSFTLTTGEVSLAEQISRLAPGAAVVKAFNQAHAKVWAMGPPVFDHRALRVPICGDDVAAKATVSRLVDALGCVPLDIGPLHRARHLEAMAAIVIGLLFDGADPVTVFNLVDAQAGR